MSLVGGDGQRRVSATGHRRGVHVGVLVQKDAADFDVAAGRRLHEGRQARLGGGGYYVTSMVLGEVHREGGRMAWNYEICHFTLASIR